MTGETIINKFNMYTDDMSELSPDDKVSLLDTKWKELQRIRFWEWARRSASVAIADSAIQLPDNFRAFVINEDYERYGGRQYRVRFFLGNDYYPIIKKSDRNRFSGLSYFDRNEIIVPGSLSLAGSAEFDYYAWLPNADEETEFNDYFSEAFQEVLAYMMASDHYLIDHTEAGQSNYAEYAGKAAMVINDMEFEDDQEKVVEM